MFVLIKHLGCLCKKLLTSNSVYVNHKLIEKSLKVYDVNIQKRSRAWPGLNINHIGSACNKIYLFKFIEKDLFQKETICGQEHQPIVQVNVFKAKLRENFMLYWKTLSHGFLIRDIDLFRAKLSHMCSI